MDRISYWWYIIGIVLLGLIFYIKEDWIRGLFIIFLIFLAFRFLVHWMKNKYILRKINKAYSLLETCDNVMKLDDELKNIILKQKNEYVISQILEFSMNCVTSDMLIPLSINSSVGNGRKCYYKSVVTAWINRQNQNVKTEIYLFDDSIDFVFSGHVSFSGSDILNAELENKETLKLIIRNKNEGIYVRSCSAVVICKLIYMLKETY